MQAAGSSQLSRYRCGGSQRPVERSSKSSEPLRPAILFLPEAGPRHLPQEAHLEPGGPLDGLVQG